MQVAEQVRQAILRLDMSHPSAKLGQFTVSIGGAGFVPGETRSIHDVMTAADTALYCSKRSGRNAVNWGDASHSLMRLAS